MSREKLTSIVILGYNEVEYTKLCIESIFAFTKRPFELVLVDNGSTDGTADYFDSIPGAKVIRNQTNLGFAKGCNQGIEVSSGDYVLLLNNDTVVTENWLDNLVSCMESDLRIGLVGPVSNFVAGPQQIEVPYGDSLQAMHEFAVQFNRRDPSKYAEAEVLIGFCLLIRRQVIETIGLLDERFGLGNFEDNDYCKRAIMAGFKLIRAGDTFIHHYGNRTFIGNSIDWRALMHQNKKLFNEKWGEAGGIVSTHELTMAKATLARIKDTVVDVDPIEAYAERYMQKPWRFPDKFVESPTLSLAMIVKDEEDNIARCLESAKDAVDEIIVVDTGSTDRTVEIAKSFGAKIYYHTWTGDFSEARNVSLDHAMCDWVMFLDADEELVREDISKLRELLDDEEHEGFFFNELSYVGEKKEDGAVANLAFRLWRNRPEYRFTGAIHEQIVAKVQANNPNIGYTEIRINHYGYMTKATEAKNKIERNLNILIREAETHPDDSFVRFNLGVEYLRLKNYDKALEQYRRAFANLSSLNAAYASMLVRNIALCLKELGRHEEALTVLRDAKEAYPDYTDLFYLEGLLHMANKDYVRAIHSFKICLAMGPAGKSHISQVGVGGHMAAYSLARCFMAIGNEREAVLAYKKALASNSRDCLTILELGLMLIHRETPADLKHFLESLADMSDEDVLFTLASVFSQGGHHDICLGYLEMLAGVSANPSRLAFLKGECLLNLRRYEDAIAELNKVSSSSQFYPPACVDRAVAYVITRDFERAIASINLLENHQEFSHIRAVYLKFAEASYSDLAPGGPMMNPKTGTGVSDRSISAFDNERKEQVERIAADLMHKLLELEEFKLFEVAVHLLEELGFSAGERSLLLGKIYYDLGYNEMAVEELIHAYENGEADGEAFFILGRTAFSNEFFEEAKTFLLEALHRDINELSLFITLSRTLIKLGEPNRAVEILDSGAKKYPDSPLITEIKESINAFA